MNGRLSSSSRKSGVQMPPLVKDWEKDVVYLIQLPRAGAIPSVSPYCLKLETWLRIANIPYRNVSNEFKHVSHKGQIPFIELNGRQHADSNQIITDLTKTFNVQMDKHLSEKEWADMQAYHCLIENSLLWVNNYYRTINNSYLATNDGMMGHLSGFKKFWFTNFVMGQIRRNLKKKCDAFGIGLDTPYEVEMVGKKDYRNLSPRHLSPTSIYCRFINFYEHISPVIHLLPSCIYCRAYIAGYLLPCDIYRRFFLNRFMFFIYIKNVYNKDPMLFCNHIYIFFIYKVQLND